MKLDEIEETDENSNLPKTTKPETVKKVNNNSNSILDLLNPLKSININSDLHSFYNFRESKMSIEALLKAQSNLVFYVLHQNFMCDEPHKEFFKNMIGRFYDVPEKLWGYYKGVNYFLNKDSTFEYLSGLVLLENGELYKNFINGKNNILWYNFKAIQSRSKMLRFNKGALLHYHGIEDNQNLSVTVGAFNRKRYTEPPFSQNTFDAYFEYYRFYNYRRHYERNTHHYWYKFNETDFKSKEVFNSIYDYYYKAALIANLGLNERGEFSISKLENIAKENGWEFDIYLSADENEFKMIRSISQTFDWTNEYIFQNEELLNLDVLGLNMSVPWDLDLVKFFIKRGYGGRMSENKAVFDKVFKPILTDEIVEMLFKLEYEKFS